MRDELLNETLFFDLDDARAKITAWVYDYNSQRPAFIAAIPHSDSLCRHPNRNGRSAARP